MGATSHEGWRAHRHRCRYIRYQVCGLHNRRRADCIAAIPNVYETLAGGGVEQDMARTWSDTVQTLSSLPRKSRNSRRALIAIAVTGQGDGMWLIDKHGEPVAPAWLWLDARAASIAEDFIAPLRLPRSLQAHRHRHECLPESIQLAWMTRHGRKCWRGQLSAFHCKDWLYFKLTGNAQRILPKPISPSASTHAHLRACICSMPWRRRMRNVCCRPSSRAPK